MFVVNKVHCNKLVELLKIMGGVESVQLVTQEFMIISETAQIA